MQPDAVVERALFAFGESGIHEIFSATASGFTPRQVGVGMAGGDRSRRRRRAAEEYLRQWIRATAEHCVLHPHMASGEVHRLVGLPQPAHDGQELVATLVAGLLGEEVAERTLFTGLTAGHDIDVKPSCECHWKLAAI